MKKLLVFGFLGAALLTAGTALTPATVEGFWREELHIHMIADECYDICISPPELCC